MKKSLIIITLLIFIALAISFYFSYSTVEENIYISKTKNEINELLESGQYIDAFSLYKSLEDKYQQILIVQIEEHTDRLCSEAIESLSKEVLIIYKNSGGDFYQVDEAIDTIDKIIQHIEDLEASAIKYQEAIVAYNSREFDDARTAFESVIDDDDNYLSALDYLEELDIRDDGWNNNNTNTRYHNQSAFDGEYLYIPYVLDGIDGIYKIDDDGKAIDFFPLSAEKSVLNVSGINVVGEYLYFIAGENVGSGYAFDSPYCIYEMKTDGSGLTLLLEGNFVDMLIIADKVFAISREFGLVEYDKNFEEVHNICFDNVVEMTFSDDYLYYTVQGDLTYDSDNTAYYYDGSESTKIDTKEYLHYYSYENEYIKLWQSATVSETLYLYDDEDEYQIAVKDIGVFCGMVDNRVIYTAIGSVGQELYRSYNLNTKSAAYLPTTNNLSDFKLLSIFYDENKLIVEKDNKLFFGNSDGKELQEVIEKDFSNDELIANSKMIKHIDSSEIYLDAGDQPTVSVITDKQNWIYRDDELLIVLEKRFVDEYDTNVYVTHIYTENFELLTTGNYNTSSLSAGASYKASKISDKYDAVYAQSTDAFYYGANHYLGIIIRQGKLVRDVLYDDMVAYYNDGHMEVFRHEDNITGSQLIDTGALMSFSFGPILVENYQVNTETAFKKLVARNPRSAIGYVEPGHYVMIACDGRDYAVSRGLNMIQLAYIFEKEGCSLAYNLDGGQTTTVLFMGNYITQRPAQVEGSQQHLHRYIAEIFYVGAHESSPLDLNSSKVEYNDYKNNYK